VVEREVFFDLVADLECFLLEADVALPDADLLVDPEDAFDWLAGEVEDRREDVDDALDWFVGASLPRRDEAADPVETLFRL
jgi:hypothetical protein